jgi:hypothetical protein
MASPVALDARPGNRGVNADLQEVAHQLHHEYAGRLEPVDIDECLHHSVLATCRLAVFRMTRWSL